MKAMEQRGHEVIWPNESGSYHLEVLAQCDVVHVYRVHGPDPQRVLDTLVRQGTPITYDMDDDLAALHLAQQGVSEQARVSADAGFQ